MIPATALGGVLFPRPVRYGGWIGWCEWEWAPERWAARAYAPDLPTHGRVRFDAADPLVAHRIADVLRSLGHEVGHLLPVALGGRVGDSVVREVCYVCGALATCVGAYEGSRYEQFGCDEHCGHGCEDGHCDPISGVAEQIVPPARVSARVLAASVEGVEQGRGVVKGVLGEWTHSERATVKPAKWPSGDYASRYCLSSDMRLECGSLIVGRHTYKSGWWLRENGLGRRGPILAEGPETGTEGMAAADAAALRLGWALLDPSARDGVRVPGEVDG